MIKGIEAQLSSLALNSFDDEAKVSFYEAYLVIGKVKSDLHYRVLELERKASSYTGSQMLR